MKKQINPSIKAHLLPSLFILLSLLVIGSTVARALPLSAGRQSQGPASDGAVGSSAPNTQAIRALEAPNDPAAWQPGPPQPPARYAFQAALGTDNLLYVAGGQTADMTPTLYNQVSRYDYTTNTWSNVAPLPVALGQGAIGAWNGKIYVAGGFIGGTSATNALRIYDITTNTWTSGPNMPTSPGVEAAAGAVVNGKFYVMGGDDFNNGLNTNFIYDTATNTWSTGATLPDNRTNTYGTAYNGLIYVYGGVILPAFTTTDTLLRYDPVANSWTNLGSAGTGGRGNYGGISPVGTGQLLITDGALNTGVSTTATHIFTISSGTFSAGPAMIGNRAGHAQGILPDGRVLVADGFNTASTVVSTVELLTNPPCASVTPTPTATATTTGSPSPTPTCTAGGGTPGPWTQAAPVAIDHYGGFMDSNGTVAWEGGGYSFSQAGDINQFGRFDPVANTWTPLAPVPDLNNAMASAVYATNVNKLFVFGGINIATQTVVNTTRIYDVASNTWSSGANMPDVRSFMASGYFNNKIYLVGGYSTGNITPAFLQVWEYDTVLNTFVTKTPVPAPAGFGGAGSGVINGRLYVAGGRDANNSILSSLWDYNIATDSWTQRANLPAADNVPGAAVISGKLWIFGGGNPFSGFAALPRKGVLAPDTTNALEIYDPASDSWSAGPNLIQARSFPAGKNVGNTAVAVGGYTGSSTTTSVEINVVSGGGCASPTPTATATATATASPSCTPSSFRVLIAYADTAGQPTDLQSQILAEPGVTACDFFDAFSSTPTLAQLEQYNIVFAFSNNAWNDATAMGNVLADYEDAGGVVVVSTFAYDNRGGWLLAGRWVTGGYSPYNSSNVTDFVTNTANITQPGNCLMQGVTNLTAFYRNGVTLTSGAVSVADWTDGPSAVAYKANNGYTAAGINAYLGVVAQPITGDWGKTIVNAGRCYLLPCGTPSPTPTATATATATATTTGTPSPTPTCPPGGTPGPWTIVANYPTTVESAAVASDGTFAYSSGGYPGSVATYRYDPVANSWSALADAPVAFADAGVAYDSRTNKVYVFGGYNGSVLDTTQIYDIASNTWSTGAPMPVGHYFAAAAYYSGNGKIYVMGGFNTSFLEDTETYEYDPVANTWNTSRAPIPVAMGGPGYSIVGQFIYLAGHWNSGAGSTDHYRYDIVGDAWASEAPVPVPIYRPGAAGVGTSEYLFGGGNPDIGDGSAEARRQASLRGPATSYNSTYIYDTGSNSWSTGPNMNEMHSFTGGAAIGNRLLVVGGFNGSFDTSTVEMSVVGAPCGTPSPTPTATATTTGSPSPTPTCTAGGGTPGPWPHAAPVAIDHYGGFMDSNGTVAWEGGGYSFSQAGNINQFGRFDPVANTWTPLAPVPDLNNAMASAVYAPNVNKLFVFGGINIATQTVVNTTRIYDVASNTWSSGANMPDVRSFMASGYFNNKIYLVGGYSTGSVTPAFLQVWEYDTVLNTFVTKTPIPAATGFGGAGSGVINGHLYVAGGRDANITLLNSLWDYNIASDSWTQRANLPAADNVPGAAVISGKLWIFGGGNPFSGFAALPRKGVLAPDTTNALEI